MSADGERHVWDAPRAILESVTDAFFLLDREFRFAYLNGTAQRVLGRDDLLGKHIWTEFPAAVGTKFQDAYERAMLEGKRVDFLDYYPAPLDRWYEVRAYPSTEGVSVYFQDITERRAADEALARSRAQMQLVVRGADVGVWYCPLPFDELIWDDKVKEHFFLPPDARVTIDTFYERLHPDDRERTRTEIARSVDERRPYDIDYRTVSADGARFKWIRASGRAFYAADGSPERFDGVTIDVSRQKEAEGALREIAERYRVATKATNDLIWDWDLATDSVLWNETLANQYGHVVPGAVTQQSFWTDHIHEHDRTRITGSIHRCIEDPDAEHWSGEYRFRRGDGSWADVNDRGFVLRDASGRAVRMIGAIQDLTERKAIERERERVIVAERAARSEAERQSRMKDDFLATLSHELRTPLNAILGWAQLILGRIVSPTELQRGLEVIERNARAQALIVDDLLDMSRMLSGKVRLDVQRVALRPLVTAVLESTQPMADARGVTLRPVVGEDLAVMGDPGRLQQVLWNLLSNAVKFTPRGGHVEVLLARVDDEVTLRVIDDGEGIGADFLPYVFDRFRQADASMSRNHGGLGLGLSIVKQVVELHGGTVRAESRGPGLGSTFTVRLPASA